MGTAPFGEPGNRRASKVGQGGNSPEKMAEDNNASSFARLIEIGIALSAERDALWSRLQAASFLTDAERRRLAGLEH